MPLHPAEKGCATNLPKLSHALNFFVAAFNPVCVRNRSLGFFDASGPAAYDVGALVVSFDKVGVAECFHCVLLCVARLHAPTFLQF